MKFFYNNFFVRVSEWLQLSESHHEPHDFGQIFGQFDVIYLYYCKEEFIWQGNLKKKATKSNSDG